MDLVPELGALLDGLQVSQAGHTEVFEYVSWGEHHEHQGSFISIQVPSHPTEPANVGGGADDETQDLQIHAVWGHHPGIENMDEFRRSVKEGIKGVVRANARALSPAWWVQVGNTVPLDEPLTPSVEGPLVHKYEIAVMARARALVFY